jgi:hypothetical protein
MKKDMQLKFVATLANRGSSPAHKNNNNNNNNKLLGIPEMQE